MDLTPADPGETCDYVPPPWTGRDECEADATVYDADSGFYYCDEHAH